jgi:hypothetical protein
VNIKCLQLAGGHHLSRLPDGRQVECLFAVKLLETSPGKFLLNDIHQVIDSSRGPILRHPGMNIRDWLAGITNLEGIVLGTQKSTPGWPATGENRNMTGNLDFIGELVTDH